MRYGKEINGGAELLCRIIAERMTRHWNVDVLTTCAIDYVTWKNEFKPGQHVTAGVNIHRFLTSRERPTKYFNFVYAILARVVKGQIQRQAVHNGLRETDKFKAFKRFVFCMIFGPRLFGRPLERLWMYLQGPISKDLSDFIYQHRKDYDAFIFFTNTYATTFYNLPIVTDRAVVVPAAHDEPCLYFRMFERNTLFAKAVIYSTPEEKALFEERFPGTKSMTNKVTGIGVEKRHPGNAERFRKKYGIKGDYIIYVGRIEESKGCKILFDFFLAYKKKNPNVTLILLGKPVMAIPGDPSIISLGFVDEEDKYDGITGARCLMMPSPYESLSIVLLEAWMSGTAVMVNGNCEVLKGQCERAQGGIAFTNAEQFERGLDTMLTDLDRTQKMAESGRVFTEKTYDWKKIEQDYTDVIASLSE